MTNVTRILSQIESGDPAAAKQLPPLVHDELRKLCPLDAIQIETKQQEQRETDDF